MKERAADADAFLLSDYQKGVLSPEIIRATVAAARLHGKPSTGNLKPPALSRDCALTVITLNLVEASQSLAGALLDTDAAVASAGRALLEKTGAEHILITRGSHGLTLFSASEPDAPIHVAAHPVAVYDVAGAGDTVISTLTLALASGGTPIEAVTLANYAAAEAVKKVGVSTVSSEEILGAFEPSPPP